MLVCGSHLKRSALKKVPKKKKERKQTAQTIVVSCLCLVSAAFGFLSLYH
jgi:hypothetical protein